MIKIKIKNLCIFLAFIFFLNFKSLHAQNLFTLLTQDGTESFSSDQLLIISILQSLPESDRSLALQDISGYQHSNVIVGAEIASRQFIRRLYDPIRSIVTSWHCEEEPDCCFSFQGYDAWLEAGGGRTTAHGCRQSHGFQANHYQLTGGIQSTIYSDWTLGIAGSFSESNTDYRLSSKGESLMGFVGFYGLYRPNGWYTFGDLTFGYHQHKLNRSISLGILEYNPHAKPKVYEASIYAEGGVDYTWNCLLIQPFLGLEVGYFERDIFNEIGTSSLNLTGFKKSYTNALSRLGFHTTANQLPCGLSLSFDLAWLCRLTSLKNSNKARFQSFNKTFTVRGCNFTRNSVEGALTLTGILHNDWEMYFQVACERWSKTSTCNLLGGIKYSW